MSVRALQIPQAPAAGGAELHVFYGSQTGNGEAVAESLAESARQNGVRVTLKSLADLRPAALKKITHAAFVMSTHGDGDPPDDALDIFEWLEGSAAKDLSALNFRVLALGDRSYTEFCAAGRQLASMLKSRGASEFAPPVECDVDYADDASRWSQELLGWARENLGTDAANDSQVLPAAARAPSPSLSIVPSTPGWTRARPFPALAERVQKITGLESDKDVYHLELSLEGSGLQYQPGDSLGVWAENDHELVSRLLSRVGLAPSDMVDDKGRHRTVRALLNRHRELTRLNTDTLEAYAQIDGERGKGKLARRWRRMGAGERRAFLEARQLIDLVEAHPVRLEAQELADLLPPLTSRTYSIASSAALVDEEVHLTVVTLRSNAIGVERRGIASQYLNHRLQTGDEARVFLEPNTRFRLPDDPSTPIIMIGAGTGIAPFRAFMQELEATGRRPGAWLIFGNPHRRTDFLYQREWLKWRADGLLDRIDGAFSRDQVEKRYVQHVVAEHSEEIDRWIRDGAVIYICGALAMGHAVEESLVDAIAVSRGVAREDAAEALKDLRRARRLLKDLY
ncbi:MAG TPA: flavodoxin domain-containing protein [Burkholderiales bacterium]|nr:flavodoxin domain-containing protein [Burkholderiales bacterium]